MKQAPGRRVERAGGASFRWSPGMRERIRIERQQDDAVFDPWPWVAHQATALRVRGLVV